MYYYIIDNKITEFKDELDNDLYNHQKLTHEQGLFYREYPNASIDEILDMELNPVYEPTLEVLKSQRIDMFSRMAFDIRNTIYPDYKLINAGLGLYDQITTDKIILTTKAFRDEFYRLKSLVENASSKEELNSIQSQYHLIQV